MNTRRDRSEPRRRLVVSDETDVGLTREHNEDSHLVTRRFFAVADGVGGSPFGEVASRTVIEASLWALDRHACDLPDTLTRRVFEAAQEKMHMQHSTRYKGMGTTLTTLAFDASLRDLVVGHSGDSRAYRFRDGVLTRLTQDEKLGGYLVGVISTKMHTKPNFISCRAEIGDVYLLCTDGVTEKLTDEQITELLGNRTRASQDRPPQVCGATNMVRAAMEAGSRDNVTAVMVRVSHHRVP